MPRRRISRLNGNKPPKGWRIPTDQDWKELEKHIGVDASEINRTGGRSKLAGKLKSPDGWMSILPAGTRNDYGLPLPTKRPTTIYGIVIFIITPTNRAGTM